MADICRRCVRRGSQQWTRPIEGVGTAMAAFVGFAPAGPVNKPTLITNWSQYVGLFGQSNGNGRRDPHLAGAYLSHAVYGYFLNGGGRCWITRVGPKVPTARGAGPQPEGRCGRARRSGRHQRLLTPGEGPWPWKHRRGSVCSGRRGRPEGSFVLRLRKGSIDEKYKGVTFGRSKGGVKNVAEAVQVGAGRDGAGAAEGRRSRSSANTLYVDRSDEFAGGAAWRAQEETPRRKPASRGWRSPKTRR